MSLQACISPILGIMGAPIELARDSDDPPFFLYSAETADLAPILAYRRRMLGGGVGLTEEEARLSCIGETLERYAGCWHGASETRFCSWRDLPDAAPHPSSYALFSQEQYKRLKAVLPFEESTRLEWTKACDLATGAPSWVPSQLVVLNHQYKPGEANIGYATSSGTALGDTRERALITALYECVERDAIMRAWLLGLSLPILQSVKASDLGLPASWTPFLSPDLCTIIDLSELVEIPCVLVALRGKWPSLPCLVFGSAAGPTLKRAAYKAVMEAYHTRTWAKNLAMARKGRVSGKIVDFEDHVYHYARPENAGFAQFLLEGPPRPFQSAVTELPSGYSPEALQSILAVLARQNVQAHAVELTPADLRQANLHTFQVTCPELCRLSVGQLPPYLGAARLAASKGEAPQLQLLPHPFP